MYVKNKKESGKGNDTVSLCALPPGVLPKLDPWRTLVRVVVPSIWTMFDAQALRHPWVSVCLRARMATTVATVRTQASYVITLWILLEMVPWQCKAVV